MLTYDICLFLMCYHVAFLRCELSDTSNQNRQTAALSFDSDDNAIQLNASNYYQSPAAKVPSSVNKRQRISIGATESSTGVHIPHHFNMTSDTRNQQDSSEAAPTPQFGDGQHENSSQTPQSNTSFRDFIHIDTHAIMKCFESGQELLFHARNLNISFSSLKINSAVHKSTLLQIPSRVVSENARQRGRQQSRDDPQADDTDNERVQHCWMTVKVPPDLRILVKHVQQTCNPRNQVIIQDSDNTRLLQTNSTWTGCRLDALPSLPQYHSCGNTLRIGLLWSDFFTGFSFLCCSCVRYYGGVIKFDPIVVFACEVLSKHDSCKKLCIVWCCEK